MPLTPRRAFLASLLVLLLAPRSASPQAEARATVPPEDHPLRIARAVRLALEGDSLPALVARWSARVARDSLDAPARFGLATAASLTYDHSRADRLYLPLYARHAAHNRVAPYARLGHARSLLVRNLLPAAVAQLDSAVVNARATADAEAEAAVRIELAYLIALTRGIPPALAMLDTAARLVPPDATELQVLRLGQRANLLAIAGRAEGPSVTDSALALARRTGDGWLLAYALRFAAKAQELRALGDSAIALYARAEALLRRARDRSALGVVLLRHSNVVIARGEYGEAKRLMELALAEGTAAMDGVTIASSSTGLGAIALNLRDFPAARAHLDRALAAFEAQADTLSATQTRYFLAMVAHGTGDDITAKRELEQAARTFARFEDTQSVFEARRALAAVLTRQRDWDGAARVLAEARRDAARLRRPLWLASLTGDEGRLALRRGDLAKAERLLARYAATADSSEHLRRYDARARLAEVYARRGDLARAEGELRAAGDALDRYRAALGDREQRLLAFQATSGEREDPVGSIAVVVNALAVGGRTSQALELAERRRARELDDALRRAAALRRVPHAVAARRVTEVASPRAAAPPERTAVIEYVAGTDGAPTTLFVVTNEGVRAYTLPPVDALAPSIERLLALVEGGADAEPLARQLGATFVAPATAPLPRAVTRLVIVPDGALHRLPFDMLRDADGRRLVERYALSIAPSARVLGALRGARAQDPRPTRLLAFGDPVFAGPGSEAASRGVDLGNTDAFRSAFATTGGLPRLAESAREAALVARYAPEPEVRVREAASAAFLKRTPLGGYRVIHFATHALVDEQTLARTALALAPGDGESGFVSPGDLAALRLDADLVVLSACRTAGGVLVGGEGVQGLTAPLLQAGARSVVATSWRIADRATVPFVRAFYDALATGLPVGDALRAAKLDAIQRGAPPSEWAAFQLIGDPTVRVPLRHPPPDYRPWIAVVAALAAAGATYSAMRRRHAVDRRALPSSV